MRNGNREGERVSIIGTGVMGKNHARTVRELDHGVRLGGIIDTDLGRAREVRDEFGNEHTIIGESIDSLDASNTDAAIIASPSQFHADQAIELMQKGIHVLVEKPVALSLVDAQEMKRVAEESGTVLMAGHVELFNPTVRALRSLMGETAIKSMRFRRLSNVDNPDRLYHDVVNDLMLHDLTIANYLSKNGSHDGVKVINAHARKETPASPDPAEAILRFPGDIDAHFRASRSYAGGKVRTIEVEAHHEIFRADLLSRTITQRYGNEGYIAPDGVFVEDIQSRQFFPSQNDQPLTLEQVHFIRSIRGETTPEAGEVSIDHALRIMKMTHEILEKIVHGGTK